MKFVVVEIYNNQLVYAISADSIEDARKKTRELVEAYGRILTPENEKELAEKNSISFIFMEEDMQVFTFRKID